MKANRALIMARTKEDPQHYLADSLGDLDYVIQRAPQDFVLPPEILTRKGENPLRLSRGPQGVVVLRQGIELKPDYWPPYEALADYYREAGDIAKARDMLKEGLAIAPSAKSLQRRLAKVDAKKTSSPTRKQGHRSDSTP